MKTRIIESLSHDRYSKRVHQACMEAGFDVSPVEVMEWQKDAWRCGYFASFGVSDGATQVGFVRRFFCRAELSP